LYYHTGRYTVSLEVTGVNGTNTEVKQGYIHVTEALGKVAGVQPSGLMTSSIKIETTQVLPDEEVTVSIDVTNHGATTASYQAILSINGKLEDSQIIDVPPGASQTAVFVTTTTNPGLYEVSIDGHSVQFIVTNNTPTEVNVDSPSSGMTGSGGLETSTINTVIAGSVGAAVAIVLVTRRRRRRTTSQDLGEKLEKVLDDLKRLGKHD
jgi:PKD repeat protein